MNLLNKVVEVTDIKQNYLTIGKFRQEQYNLIEYFMKLAVDYISKQNKNYLKLHKITIGPVLTYTSIHNSMLTSISVEVTTTSDPTKTKLLFKALLPTLIEGSFFIINENYYVPTVYILDKPIVIKKNSIKLSSTFNSITIYEKLVTFMGTNIPAKYFLDLFLDSSIQEYNDLKRQFCSKFRIVQQSISENDLLNYYSNMLKCNPNRKEICEYYEKVFFDDYTKLLYQNCYNFKEEEITIPNLLKKVLEITDTLEEDNFIDLKYKRVVFIEALLSPLFKRIALAASQAARGFQVTEISMDQLELVKHFHIGLSSRFIYDSANAYDVTFKHRAYMLNPNAENAPGIIANLHPTHYKRICPISVSAQRPGEAVYITAETLLDYFGQFIGV